MQEQFWLDKWKNNQIGFHQHQVNEFLAKYIDKLSLQKNDRIFVPLCGKSLDIHWLLDQGLRVVAIELSELAVEELIKTLNLPFEEIQNQRLRHFHHPQIDIFNGDIFQLTKPLLGDVDAIYDRAALVALPENMRVEYAQHLKEITNNAPQLLISYEYDQDAFSGPPFSIPETKIKGLYDDVYNIEPLIRIERPRAFQQQDAIETAWYLAKKIDD
ncbi:thiopurine S-methyltransferase [Acinetobacter sp. ANC 3791]|uniref:thiopurine S-methyltransferase n=1 Tax=Acinetobacter sp. ANC 3791 TaxID=2529836 RepID=UPI00103F9D29|nr:thiopurine S-methyltransferase [Acinetobacter sp. ANC 3791]TCB82928.1 thiopurine S-methyltransferase [Acinetobacter sp. ANC 3791]